MDQVQVDRDLRKEHRKCRNSEDAAGAPIPMSRFCGTRRTSEGEEGVSRHLASTLVQLGRPRASAQACGPEGTAAVRVAVHSPVPGAAAPLAQSRCSVPRR